ncbi:hypothetical protein DUI87_34194 [Hirundo rustica rustica]|uniref:MHC class I-like antigen recognition-like domain-containing protein n=1 Tax=Hirundo rustica rustica TaxID=333673 RepID=A0A3M0IR74_HIRRU|nr:hypothetical protein DUI87_34194 [Hirundo rustica rustica]
MAHTGLLGGIVLMMFIKHTYETKACTNCYHPVYDGEDLRSLFRVHTNVNPNCFDHSQLNTCQEDGKVYWTTKNTASYAQRLFGECPIGDTWLCFEADQKGLRDIIKEKVLTTKFEKSLDIPSGKNLFIDLVERIRRELNLTEYWICGGTQMSEIWPWERISLSPLEILKWKQTEQNTQSLRTRGREKWDLKSKIIGEECIMRTGTRTLSSTSCTGDVPGVPEGIVHGFGDSGADGAQVGEGQVEQGEEHGRVQVVATGYGADDEADGQEGSQGDAQEEAEVQELQLPRVCQCQQEEVADGAAVGHLLWLAMETCSWIKDSDKLGQAALSQTHAIPCRLACWCWCPWC